MKTTRSYRMTARAEAVEQTRSRVLDATVALHFERPVASISLDDVAARAGVSVQTVLRHFKSRAGLVEAAIAERAGSFRGERRAPVGDVARAVRAIVAHYELRGDGVLVLLAQEPTEPLARRIADTGRREHRAWVEEVFAPHLAGRADAAELVDLLVVATDLYAWKLLRRDRGLSRRSVEGRMARLVDSVLAHRQEPHV